MTPVGVIDNLDETLTKCTECDWPPDIIIPVPVAIDEAGRYEIISRGA